MTQYTHEYLRSESCGNFQNANGVIKKTGCHHVMQYELPHCAVCGRESTSSVHDVPKAMM